MAPRGGAATLRRTRHPAAAPRPFGGETRRRPGSRRLGAEGADCGLILDAPNQPDLPVLPGTAGEGPAGAVIVAVAGAGRASSAVSRGAAVVGPKVYAADDAATTRVAVCAASNHRVGRTWSGSEENTS